MDNDQGLDNLLAYADIRPAVNQIEVHPLMTQEENIAYNHSLSIQVEAWGPFERAQRPRDVPVVTY